MATDVNVQFFSHLNGLTLGNNWGDLVRLLDTTLVNGIELPSITATSIDEQGDVHLTLFAPHQAMLFQVVELSGFEPTSLNQKYRIKGTPSANQLVLKPEANISETLISTKGSVKLSSLGYEIIFRDTEDVKRVYRSKNPTAQHPFIRIDESLASSSGEYSSNYAKYAMVGLLERMDHIDDYDNAEVLQLPFDPSEPAKNWKITGSGADVIRGWSRWYWAHQNDFSVGEHTDTATPSASNNFCITGCRDAFYIAHGMEYRNAKILYGCGLYDSSVSSSVIPNWFLQSSLKDVSAGTSFSVYYSVGFAPLMFDKNRSAFFTPTINELSPLSKHSITYPILPDYYSGISDVLPKSDIGALSVPFCTDEYLLGSLKHIHYAYKRLNDYNTPEILLSKSSMYLATSLLATDNENRGGVYFYLGDLE